MRGRTFERNSQAHAVIELNTRLANQQGAEAQEEVVVQARIAKAVAEAKAAIPVSEPGKPSACALDEGSIRRIRAIVKSAQVTP
jgi:hypothetical protein